MEKEQRSKLQKATQEARRLLEEEFSRQLLETYDINVAAGRWSEDPGAHLQAEQRLLREKLLAWIEHRSAQINDEKEALLLALREMAFTALNRFVALKLMEARELVRPCVSGGLESEGFQEFTAVAQGLLVEQESSYRLYLETIFEDVSRELRALFDPRDPASLLWPKRTALLELLDILNRPELAELWREDETLGWIYQYFNGDAERKKMREESSAPRNSRELAVRNQFFTPRYVVEFLTDNTLGRIWYEMRQGDTGLKERCRYLVRRPNEIWLQSGEEPPAEVVADEAISQEELLRQPVHIPYRPLKDPREIRMLDPACGSMHFGLYAFDLYLAIYEEAWEIAHGSDEQAKQGEAFAPFVTYTAGFARKAAFLREVPRLILLHNIHGVDIDPRATQIARLTLWLRAQRAWQEQGVEVAARPAITRSNVVCAEPMPGERELLADFVDQQFPEAERGLVQQLLETIFDKMQLAGEAGSLLKIEEEVRDAIEQGQRDWQKLAIRQRDLFSATEFAELGGVGSSLNADLQNLTRDFWVGIEERIYTALRHYAEQAEYRRGYQRRLFAEDAAQGFAFIDICRKRYDVTLMNPPFGEPIKSVLDYMSTAHSGGKNDIYAAMIIRLMNLSLSTTGLLGAITSRAFSVGRDLLDFRKEIVGGTGKRISILADLGAGVLDGALVETAAYIISSNEQGELLHKSVRSQEVHKRADAISSGEWKVALLSTICSLPGLQLLLELESEAISRLQSGDNFSAGFASTTQGLATEDDSRFVRLKWEVSAGEIGYTWHIFSKGGDYSWYSGDLHLVVKRHLAGAEIAAFAETNSGNIARTRQSSKYYGTPGAAFSKRSQKGFSCRRLRAGACFSNKNGIIFPSGEDAFKWTSALPLLLSSSEYLSAIEALSKFGNYETGSIGLLPRPANDLLVLSELATDVYLEMDMLEQAIEPSSLFVSPLHAVASRAEACRSTLDLVRSSLQKVGLRLASVVEENILNAADSHDVKSFRVKLRSDFVDVADLVSYAVGACVGQWDINFAIGKRLAPALLNPFAPLPICPPGQLQNDHGLPALQEDVAPAYPVLIPWNGILVDDPNHPLDLDRRIREVIAIIWGGQEGSFTSESVEHEVCEILGVKTLRDYFRKSAGFFADHLKRYSKSRRQAPIYWQVSAGNGSYSVWLYYHRFTQDTLYRVLRDFVEPRIQEAEREQFELESQGAISSDSASRLREVQILLQDLIIFKSELGLVASLWSPNLNDGVIINHAILWRVTPYAPWQNKCKECWDKLVKGDYDWAHLAFHLWPERVIRKCITDRSLAIAHGLVERLWQETSKGNWLQRQLPEAELEALLAEYSKPAVQNAIERFLAASPPVAATRTRAPRAGKSSSTGTTRRPRASAPEVDAETSRQTLLVLTAAPAEGLGRNAIAELLGVEAASLTAVIKQLKEGGQIEQLGAARGAKYRLSESGLAAVESQAGEEE